VDRSTQLHSSIVKPTWIAAALLSFAAIGCQSSEPKSPYHLQSSSGAFAATYPERLLRESKAIRQSESVVRSAMGGFPTAADKLGDTDWAVVEQIVEKADQAGRDEGYAAQMRDLRSANEFFEEEHEPLVKKVGGAAHYAGKQRGCDIELWSPVASSMKDGVDERIRARLHASNDAFLVIERNRDKLGKKAVPALEELAEDIAHASYIVYVELPLGRERLHETIEGVESARLALQSSIEDEKAHQNEPSLRIEDRKASEARIASIQEKLGQLKDAETDARANLEDLEKRSKQLEEDYAVALSTLKDDIASREAKK